ncbi:MAG: VOC family protein [Dehalococcoidia bacterium]|nr:VOC family protein [Dehalococcoidia bacterium]
MILDVHHVGIAVRSLEAAYALYRDALGLPLVKEGAVPARGVRAALLAAGRSYLEVLEPVTTNSPFAKHIAERGEGLHHLALWSDDVDGDVERLRDLGAPLTDHEPRDGFTGRLAYLAPLACDGALLEVVQPFGPAQDRPEAGGVRLGRSGVKRIDHVVLRVPDVGAACGRFQSYFGVPTKRTMERGTHQFAFLRPGDVVIEVIGPREGGEPDSGRIAGLALEVTDIDGLTASLKAKGYPIGEPHPALQGGRIVSVHHSGACGVPLAFIDFS